MVKGELALEKKKVDYRSIDAINQSGLILYSEDPSLFYRKYILKEKLAEETSVALSIGCLVDFYVLDCGGNEEMFNQRFDEKFCLFGATKSSSQVFVLADELFKITSRKIENGVVTEDISDVDFQEAFLNTQALDKYKGKVWRQGFDDFVAKGREYYSTLLRSIGKITVDLPTLDIAKRVAGQLISDENVNSWLIGGDNIEVLTKVVVEFELSGMKCKVEIDILVIDFDSNTALLGDLKCTYNNEEFPYSYIKRKYYIQQAFYYLAALKFIEENYKGFKVIPMSFVVADTSSNRRKPLVYRTTVGHRNEGLQGFVLNNRAYKGVYDLMNNLKWSVENDIWDISYDNYVANQHIFLPSFNNTLQHDSSS